jgi:thiol-disulfide isomerase/thioredoxin
VLFKRDTAEIPIVKWDYMEKILQSSDDQTYIINFWATWCKPCVEEMPDFIKLNDELKGKAFKMVLISLDFPSQIESRLKPYIAENDIEAEIVVLDDPNSNAWIPLVSDEWSGAIPATLLYNREKRSFYEQKLDYKKLKEIVKHYIKF